MLKMLKMLDCFLCVCVFVYLCFACSVCLCFGFSIVADGGNQLCVLFGSLLPAACFAFHSPELRPLFVLFCLNVRDIATHTPMKLFSIYRSIISEEKNPKYPIRGQGVSLCSSGPQSLPTPPTPGKEPQILFLPKQTNLDEILQSFGL